TGQSSGAVVFISGQMVQRVFHGGALAGEQAVGIGVCIVERILRSQQVCTRRVISICGHLVARVCDGQDLSRTVVGELREVVQWILDARAVVRGVVSVGGGFVELVRFSQNIVEL